MQVSVDGGDRRGGSDEWLADVVVVFLLVGTGVAAFLGLNWSTNRAGRRGLYGASVGAWLGLETEPGDPHGLTACLPVLEGVRRKPVSTGVYEPLGGVAVVEQHLGAGCTTVFYMWIDAGLDADVVLRSDGSIERAHGTRGGLADRVVRAVALSVPEAAVVWAAAGSAPPSRRDQFDRASAEIRSVGIDGDGPVGAVGLALPADLMTNPVAWLRWLREVVHYGMDGAAPPAPPSVGFG